jgi:uncharacterized protein (DUF697 family)
LDSSASRFLAETVRDAFVPQTTSGIVRVERLGEERIAPKTDTDVVLVLSCGSDRLESAVQELVIAGAPVCVLAESAVEVPFGVVAATDKTYLLETLARWILDRTDKETAFAANFAFMRIAAANRIITSCALTNMATGALVFLPGADYPVMALAQVGMLFELAAVFGRGIKPERGYEVAGVLAGGLVIRAVTRALVKQTPHIGFAVKALTAAAGTYGMGRALVSLYERDVDYSRANEVVTATFSRVRDLVTTVAGTTRPMASYQDASDLAA